MKKGKTEKYVISNIDLIKQIIVKDAREEIKSWVKRYVWTVVAILGFFGFTTYTGIRSFQSEIIANAKRDIEAKITYLYDEANITAIIDEIIKRDAATLIKEQAKIEAASRIESEIKPFSEEIRTLVSKARGDVDDLNRFVKLIEHEEAARYGSRSAYNELLKVSLEKSKYQEMAKRMLVVIMRDLTMYMSPPSMYQTLSYTDVNGKVISVGNLSTKRLFSEIEDPMLDDQRRHTLMVYISEKPKKEVLQESQELLIHSNSLPAIAATCGILAKILGEKAEFMDTEKWIRVCKEELVKL